MIYGSDGVCRYTLDTGGMLNEGDKVVVRVTNPGDATFGVLKAEETITIGK